MVYLTKSSVCCSKNTHNSVVKVLEHGLELGSDGGLGGTALVEPLHEFSERFGGNVRVRWLLPHSIVRSVEFSLVGDSPDPFEVSVDR